MKLQNMKNEEKKKIRIQGKRRNKQGEPYNHPGFQPGGIFQTAAAGACVCV